MTETLSQNFEHRPEHFDNKISVARHPDQPHLDRYEIQFADDSKIIGSDTENGQVTLAFLDNDNLPIRAGILFSDLLYGKAEDVIKVIDRIQVATQLHGNALPEILEAAVSALIRQKRIDVKRRHLRENQNK